MFHADGQKNRRDEGNSRFSQFCERGNKALIRMQWTTESVLCMEVLQIEHGSSTYVWTRSVYYR